MALDPPRRDPGGAWRWARRAAGLCASLAAWPSARCLAPCVRAPGLAQWPGAGSGGSGRNGQHGGQWRAAQWPRAAAQRLGAAVVAAPRRAGGGRAQRGRRSGDDGGAPERGRGGVAAGPRLQPARGGGPGAGGGGSLSALAEEEWARSDPVMRERARLQSSMDLALELGLDDDDLGEVPEFRAFLDADADPQELPTMVSQLGLSAFAGSMVEKDVSMLDWADLGDEMDHGARVRLSEALSNQTVEAFHARHTDLRPLGAQAALAQTGQRGLSARRRMYRSRRPDKLSEVRTDVSGGR
ncbi:unnamed protein product [Prorocentrum cordatum]|uniref:Uncharacterized protein n=1 Tax=Prorocentrum cordatum TaxID=2364126 RepID=A0ABN9PIC4_9DINO|nr:unnamed protein product [Polarella glacialis]